jgi:hypothetical protein
MELQPSVYFPPPPQQEEYGIPSVVPELKLPENDYRFFQYSRLALPFLLFILGVFVTLILLTMWQSRSDIRGMKAGVPRTFQTLAQKSSSVEAGVSKGKRNVRIASFFMGVTFAGAAIIVYFTDMPPVLRARLNYPLGLLLILDCVLTWIAFALDVNSERHTIWCYPKPNESPMQCQSREDLGTGNSVFDAFHALFLLVSGLLVIGYTYTGDWCRESESFDSVDPDMLYQQSYKPTLVRNGVSTVRRTLTMMALLMAVVTGIILCIFTIMVSQNAETTVLKDFRNASYYDTTANSPYTTPGWPLKCTKLRYAVCSFVIITVLFNLVPLTSRVIAYVVGFLYILYAVMAYSSFGIDVAAINDAKNLTCPQGISCGYDSFNAVIVFDFMGGTLLIMHVVYEYIISKRAKKIPAANVVVA